jgi:hypothetical protein
MGSFEAAGSIWILVSGFAIALAVAFRGDATAWLATNVTGVVAAMIGAFIIWRPSRRVARASISWGVAWLILYGALAVIQVDDLPAWITDLLLGAVGGVAALVTYRVGIQSARAGRVSRTKP